MENCIFCKIIKGEIPCAKVYEDKDFLAFLDINPVTSGHTLVIPKKHIEWMQDVDDITLAESFRLTKKLMLAIKNGLSYDYVQISIVGKDVPHFHIHLIPRHLNDGLPQYKTTPLDFSKTEELISKITKEL
jgi:histidine triad (HIT) family protein